MKFKFKIQDFKKENFLENGGWTSIPYKRIPWAQATPFKIRKLFENDIQALFQKPFRDGI